MTSIMNPLYKKRKNYGTSKPASIGGKKVMSTSKRAKTSSKTATKPKAVKKRTIRSTMPRSRVTAVSRQTGNAGSPFTKKIGTGATKKMSTVVSAATIRKLSPTEKSKLQKILKKNQELQNKAKQNAAAKVIKSNTSAKKPNTKTPAQIKAKKEIQSVISKRNAREAKANAAKNARVNKRETAKAKRLSETKAARDAQRKRIAEGRAKNLKTTKERFLGRKYIKK